jgi:hypothetical protein
MLSGAKSREIEGWWPKWRTPLTSTRKLGKQGGWPLWIAEQTGRPVRGIDTRVEKELGYYCLGRRDWGLSTTVFEAILFLIAVLSILSLQRQWRF